MRGRFIDNVVNRFADFRKRRLFESDPIISQKRVLQRLLKAGAKTAFARQHDFISIGSANEFLSRVAVSSYGDLKPSIDRVLNGQKDVLFPGGPVCFGTTTGTTGKPKLIPQNYPMLRDTRFSAIDALLIGGTYRKSMSWLRGKTLYIGPRKAGHIGKWKVFAEGTGFVYLQAAVLRARIVPKYEQLPQPESRADYEFLLDCLKSNRITVIAGNPLEIADFLLATKTASPQVEIVVNCGYWAVDCEHIYRGAFENATVVDIYGSNEGVWGLPVSFGTFLLNHTRVFFSFAPLGSDGEALSLENVRPGRKYRLCVTTSGGLWNYMTGDVVCFESIRPPVFRLCGRSSRILPVGDDWLTENEVAGAVHGAGLNITKYCLSKEAQGCVLYVDGVTPDAEEIDQNLCRMNLAYARLRTSGKLKTLVVSRRNMETSGMMKSAKIETGT